MTTNAVCSSKTNMFQTAVRGLAGIGRAKEGIANTEICRDLRLPSDAGDDEMIWNDLHSPRPHEAPSDFRCWYKLSNGTIDNAFSNMRSLRSESEAVVFLVNGRKESNSQRAMV
eukprot:CAMPEP_0113700318 /NCGR_PEP_ID=MMETSP0038_2-20120614/23887_1 /TAXON_ID=2898 /ORGANISM="Cryptomonas paramecium" /LENGTH=113 /DNA_ID=CAMNT_0000623955 /DNA_START=6 /DNA_END=347 /DNA_ORIENTATION=- /assembly_acc=CAM_ASM_000170